MAAYGWRDDRPLNEALYREPFRFEFYQAVKLTEILFPERLRVGEDSRPDRETARFRAHVSFEFPASEVYDLQESGDAGPDIMDVSVMGLAGNLGPLPISYTNLILDRIRRKDEALKDFLDIFNHRFISLLYRLRKTCRIAFKFESPEKSHFSKYLFAFMGMATDGLQNRVAFKDRSFLYYSGLISQQPHSMPALEAMVSHYFNVPCKGIPLRGNWLPVAEDQITRLGKTGQNRRLGRTVLVGHRVWVQQDRFALRLGPMDLELYLDLLPCGPGWNAFCRLVKFYAGDLMYFNAVLMVKKEQVPGAILNRVGGSRLGWTSWLSSGKSRTEPGIARFKPEGIASMQKWSSS